MDRENTTYETVARFAERTGLPVGWVRWQARTGDLPSIRAGRTRLIHVAEADAVLARRAAQKNGGAK